MSNPMKVAYDRASWLKDISDREQIIRSYQLTGYLDRDSAIEKIRELRQIDAEVTAATEAKLAVRSIPFEKAPDQTLVAELQMQVNILSAKLLVNQGISLDELFAQDVKNGA